MPTDLTKDQILGRVARGEISVEQGTKFLNEVNPPWKCRELSCRVAPKGGLSVYGLQRAPVTLYPNQWERLIAYIPQVQAFIADNRAIMRWSRNGAWAPEENKS